MGAQQFLHLTAALRATKGRLLKHPTRTTVGTRQATRLSLPIYIAAPNVGSSTVVGSCTVALKEDSIADRLAEVSAIRCNEFEPRKTGMAAPVHWSSHLHDWLGPLRTLLEGGPLISVLQYQ
jgi:hypothetical protein